MPDINNPNFDIYSFAVLLYDAFHIPHRRVTEDCSPDEVDLGLRNQLYDAPAGLSARLQHFLHPLESRVIYHIRDNFHCHYYFIRSDEAKALFCLGPILYETMSETHIRKLIEKESLPGSFFSVLCDYYTRLTYLPGDTDLLNITYAVMEYIYGANNYRYEVLDYNAGEEWMQFFEGHLHVEDTPLKNIYSIENRYRYENEMLAAVRSGNTLNALLAYHQLRAQPYNDRLTDVLRDKKNYSITLNSILRKAAEEGGVHPIHIDSISNENVRRIEAAADEESLNLLQQDIIRRYCDLVLQLNTKEYSLPIQRVMTIIHTDLSTDLSLKSLSDALNLNAAYLSTRFKHETGVTLTEFVNEQRIRHAQRLLRDTNLPIKEIAQQCGISDLYYFSRLFKRTTGMAPRQYRETE